MKLIQTLLLLLNLLQDTLLSLAKAVATATASLVMKAKEVAKTAEEPAQQEVVISSATQCALATSQLVACSKVQQHSLKKYETRTTKKQQQRQLLNRMNYL